MTFYLDTSVIVSWLIGDVNSGRADGWLAGHNQAQLAVSDWSIPEVSSALARLIRMKRLTNADWTRGLQKFSAMRTSNFETLSVRTGHFGRAAALVDQYTLGLRAPDALHLAVAESVGATMVTFDDRLADACRAVDVKLSDI